MLYVYENITPNTDGKHYYFTSVSAYKNKLAPNIVEIVSLDNFRINTNIIKIKINSTLTEAKADKITYAIDERTDANNNITYFRAYHVNRVLIQSGYVILNCSVDLWASYLYKATITNLNVTRCNRNIGIGLLDDIRATKGAPTRTYCYVANRSQNGATIQNQLYDITKVYIVFALKYNVEQNLAGSVSRIELFAFNLKDLRTSLFHANNDTFAYSIVNPVKLAMDVVSGIYGIVGINMWGAMGTLNAVVLGAWFTDVIVATDQNDVQIKTKANWNNFTDVTLTPKSVGLFEQTLTLEVTNDFNKQFYLGTMHNGLKLARTTESKLTCTFKTIASNDKITCIMQQGDLQEDITQAFAVTLGTTDGDVTAERQMVETFKMFAQFMGNGLAIAGGAMTGNAVATAIGINGLVGSIASNLERKQYLGGMVKGGDGALAYYRIFSGTDIDHPENNLSSPLTNPYIINAYESIDDEDTNARVFGASFSEYTTFANIFSASLIGTSGTTDTYVRATCIISGIPNDAIESIKNKLAIGVYMENLTA